MSFSSMFGFPSNVWAQIAFQTFSRLEIPPINFPTTCDWNLFIKSPSEWRQIWCFSFTFDLFISFSDISPTKNYGATSSSAGKGKTIVYCVHGNAAADCCDPGLLKINIMQQGEAEGKCSSHHHKLRIDFVENLWEKFFVLRGKVKCQVIVQIFSIKSENATWLARPLPARANVKRWGQGQVKGEKTISSFPIYY